MIVGCECKHNHDEASWQVVDDSDQDDKGIFVVSNGKLSINIPQPTSTMAEAMSSGGLSSSVRNHADRQQSEDEAELEKASTHVDEVEFGEYDKQTLPAKKSRRVAVKQLEGPRRTMLVTAWLSILLMDPWASQTGQQVCLVEHDEGITIVGHTVADKATATLASRLSSLGSLVKWCADGARGVWWPPPEWGVYRYVTETAKEHGPLTRANQLVESIGFFFHTFGCWTFSSIVSSRRIVGLAKERMAKLVVRKQARVLTLQTLITLEGRVYHGSLGILEMIVIGGCLLLTYARARFSDFDSSVNLEWLSGILVVTVIGTKTSRRHTDRLPIQFSIPLTFASGLDWLSVWIKWRIDLGSPLLQWLVFPGRDSDDVWINRPAAGFAVCTVVRNVLSSLGVESVGEFTLHTFKAMWLFLCSVVGVEEGVQQILGHHVVKATTTLRTYSRDTQAYPVRILIQIIKSVESGAITDKEGGSIGWKADDDRKEFVISNETVGDDAVNPNDKAAAMEAAMETDSGSDDECMPMKNDDPEEQQRLYDEGMEEVADSVSIMATRLFLEGVQVDGRFFINEDNSKVHCGRKDCENYMGCGNLVTQKMIPIASADDTDSDAKFCSTCFLVKRPETSKILKQVFSKASEDHWDSWNSE